MGEQDMLEAIETDSGQENIVNDGVCNMIGPWNEESEHIIQMNTQC